MTTTSEVTGAAWDLYEMTQALMHAPTYHLIFEACLIFGILWLVFKQAAQPRAIKLTKQEEDALIEEWQPEPLVPPTDPNHPALLNENRLVDGKYEKIISINGNKCLNLATFNFLNMERAIKTLHHYGVGSCGPRGFYGTFDVHLEIEENLAKFMGVEEAILYSYNFPTIASAIPAYSKRADVIFADEGCCFSIQKGIQASRSTVKWFKHNDLEDLRRLLNEQRMQEIKNPKKSKSTRKFLIVEGLYINYADLCPLPELIKLREEYKVRLFMDESMSFATIGATGRGVTEHYNVDINDVDLITCSLENAIASFGGFCCGPSYVVDHQRLSGLGYCFSASLPPLLTTAASEALLMLQENPNMLQELRALSEYMHKCLTNLPLLEVHGDAISPIKHLRLQRSTGSRDADSAILRKIVHEAEERQIALVVAAYLAEEEHKCPEPSIRIAVSIALTKDDIDSSIAKIVPLLEAEEEEGYNESLVEK